MAHFNFVISQNAKWGHAGFYIDCHRMTVPENILLQKKHWLHVKQRKDCSHLTDRRIGDVRIWQVSGISSLSALNSPARSRAKNQVGGQRQWERREFVVAWPGDIRTSSANRRRSCFKRWPAAAVRLWVNRSPLLSVRPSVDVRRRARARS